MFSFPVPLNTQHKIDAFDCGEPSLNEWLQKRALRNMQIGVSRTFVVMQEGEVVGYYCLAAGSVARAIAPKKLQRNMPDPLPVLVLGRLAIDKKYQQQGLGKALLRDAVQRSLYVAETAGVVALLVHALSDAAKQFYLAQGFMIFPDADTTLCLPLSLLHSNAHPL